MKSLRIALLSGLLASGLVRAHVQSDNSNFWPVHRDDEFGFVISYPKGWVSVPPRGPNIRFSVNPPNGPGNCNVMARSAPQAASLTQKELNVEIDALPQDKESWAGYSGASLSSITLVESHRAKVRDVPALVATLEVRLENLEGKFTRKQMVAFTFTPGTVWSVNCGASTFSAEDARARFAQLEPTFKKIFGSFALRR